MPLFPSIAGLTYYRSLPTWMRITPPRLYVTVGASGVGKTTAAKIIGQFGGGYHLEFDALGEGVGYNHNTAGQKVADIARHLLMNGEDVILDGTFISQKMRDIAAELAHETGARLVFIHPVTTEKMAQARAAAKSVSHLIAHNSQVKYFDLLTPIEQAATIHVPGSYSVLENISPWLAAFFAR